MIWASGEKWAWSTFGTLSFRNKMERFYCKCLKQKRKIRPLETTRMPSIHQQGNDWVNYGRLVHLHCIAWRYWMNEIHQWALIWRDFQENTVNEIKRSWRIMNLVCHYRVCEKERKMKSEKEKGRLCMCVCVSVSIARESNRMITMV